MSVATTVLRSVSKVSSFGFRVSRWQKLLTVYLLTLLCLTACQTQDDTWPNIQETGILRVGLDPTYPPFEVANETDLWGFDVDLARAIGDDLEVTVQFIHIGYDGLYDALLTHQVDVLISGLVIQLERTKDFAYSEPYFNAGQVLLVPEASEIEEMADLSGRSLAVELGSEGHVLGTEWTRQIRDLTVVPFGTPEEAVAAAAAGVVEAVLIDHISGRLHRQAYPHLIILAEPITVEPYAFVVRTEDDTLLENLNNSLEKMIESEELDALSGRWLDGAEK